MFDILQSAPSVVGGATRIIPRSKRYIKRCLRTITFLRPSDENSCRVVSDTSGHHISIAVPIPSKFPFLRSIPCSTCRLAGCLARQRDRSGLSDFPPLGIQPASKMIYLGTTLGAPQHTLGLGILQEDLLRDTFQPRHSSSRVNTPIPTSLCLQFLGVGIMSSGSIRSKPSSSYFSVFNWRPSTPIPPAPISDQ